MTRLSTSIEGDKVICPITKEAIHLHLCILKCRYEAGYVFPGYVNCEYNGPSHNCNYVEGDER